ncbi:MAG: lipoprotein insertase outer membrane protein LolB [Gammaproteobacteria bacterium]|nr:lipoprotein insertase outer membrane protein LolB [Gammaproteobacteria bacterium]
MSFPLLRALVVILIASIGLSACSRPGLRPDVQSTVTVLDWQQRQIRLNDIHQWDVSGRIAMQTTDDAWSASMEWQQSGDNYDIRLFGPLGGEALSIKGQQDFVELTNDDGEIFTAASAAELIYRQTGWRVPVDGLRYWVRALAAPQIPAEHFFNQGGRLSELRQLDWIVYYQDYQQVNNLEMPRKIRLEHGHFTVKLILRDWQLERRLSDT